MLMIHILTAAQGFTLFSYFCGFWVAFCMILAVREAMQSRLLIVIGTARAAGTLLFSKECNRISVVIPVNLVWRLVDKKMEDTSVLKL
jgi:hypothetical protein